VVPEGIRVLEAAAAIERILKSGRSLTRDMGGTAGTAELGKVIAAEIG
jgi:hypothetical protein